MRTRRGVGLTGGVAVAAGGGIDAGHSLAVTRHGDTYAWGCDRWQQLGLGSAEAGAVGYTWEGGKLWQTAPRRVEALRGVVDVAAGADHSLALAGDEAVVVEASWHGSTVVPLPLGGPFHARRLTLKSSQVGNLPPSKRPRWDYTRRMNLALKLAGDASLDVLFERDAVAFEDLPAALPSICGARAGAAGLCHRVVYS